MVSRTARRFRHDALEPQPPQIQLVDKHGNRPHRIVFSYEVVKKLGEQNALRSVLALNKRFIQNPDSIHQDSDPTNGFTQPDALLRRFLRRPSDDRRRPSKDARSATPKSSLAMTLDSEFPPDAASVRPHLGDDRHLP
jgi:hypothetical protein